MPGVTKAILHGLIRDVFLQACQSSTPFSAVAHWSVQFRESSKLSKDDVDQVADAVVRMVALHRRAFGSLPTIGTDYCPPSKACSQRSPVVVVAENRSLYDQEPETSAVDENDWSEAILSASQR